MLFKAYDLSISARDCSGKPGRKINNEKWLCVVTTKLTTKPLIMFGFYEDL